jgi:uncharacterized glyoxalase superfamily protein PhnB
MPVKPIPEGYHTLTPFLVVKGASGFIDFIKKAFDAKEIHRSTSDDGTIWHAEFKIGDSHLMLSEASGDYPATPVMLYMYVEDVDSVYKRALSAGGTSLREPTNEFYGDRSGGVKDEFGNQWWLGTHVEDVSPEEMKRREEEWKKKKK